MGRFQQSLLIAVALAAPPLLLRASGIMPVFFPDDPIQAMPAPVSVGTIEVHKIDQPFDFIINSLQWKPRPAVPADAVNTLGEPPDSAWFQKRHGRNRMTREELQRGTAHDEPPVAPFTIVGGKSEGITPGFRMQDARGRTYFVKVDPQSNPELATAADVIVSRFLYAIGYNVPENDIVRTTLANMRLSEKAQLSNDTAQPRPMTWDDVEDLIKAIPHYPDGSFRLMASLKIEGDSVGPFRYEGTRTDDPNDLVPHENRRDLRALYVFYSWLNNTDARADNSYDTVVKENGISFVKHFLLDFGSALGSDGDSPKDVRLGHEFMIATPGEALRSILTLGLAPHEWETLHYSDLPAVGNFSAKDFHPDDWTSDYPNPAFLSRLPDDDFWGAEQVMAFTDDDIRAIVETGQFTDPRVVDVLTKTIAERRDRIGRKFFSKVLPLDNFRVTNDELHFDDLAARYDFRPARTYEVHWYRFDNTNAVRTPIMADGTPRLPEDALQAGADSYFSAVIQTTNEKARSVIVTIRKEAAGYRVVGCTRTWSGEKI